MLRLVSTIEDPVRRGRDLGRRPDLNVQAIVADAYPAAIAQQGRVAAPQRPREAMREAERPFALGQSQRGRQRREAEVRLQRIDSDVRIGAFGLLCVGRRRLREDESRDCDDREKRGDE